MSDHLRFQVRGWLAGWHGDAVERMTLGELTISARGLMLTELEDEQTRSTRGWTRVSMLRLGGWLASNWWRLRWELRPEPPPTDSDWHQSHCMAGAGGGYLWPSIKVISSGDSINVLSRSTRRHPGEPVRYLNDADLSLSVEEFEGAVDEMMAALVERLEALGKGDHEVARLWRDVLAERHDPDTASFRRREALLGLDPDRLDVEAVQRLIRDGRWMGESALDEVLAGTVVEAMTVRLQGLKHHSAAPPLLLDLSPFAALTPTGRNLPEAQRSVAAAPPWERGRDDARSARAQLGLGHGPLSPAMLSDLVGAQLDASAVDALRFGAGFRTARGLERVGAWLGHGRHPTSRRFEVVRLIADTLSAPIDDQVLPIADSRSARQRYQRAFAQEFLCPVEGLRQHLDPTDPSEDEIAQVADRYVVSEWTVRSALVNHGLMDRRWLPEAG